MLIYSYPPQELANFRLRNEAHAACILDVSSYYICVRILYLCPHIIYVSSGARQLPTAQRSTCSVYTRCVLILYMRPDTIFVSSFYICVLRSSPTSDCATKRMQRVLYMGPHTLYVSAYYICVLILSSGARQLPTAQRSICSARASYCRYSVYLLY
jgi:hypothetical protein